MNAKNDIRKETAVQSYLDRLAFRTALIFSFLAWAGVVYGYLTAKTTAMDSSAVLYKPPDISSWLSILCAAISLACSANSLRGNLTDFKAWLFVLWCSAPFVVLMSLFDPLGMAPPAG